MAETKDAFGKIIQGDGEGCFLYYWGDKEYWAVDNRKLWDGGTPTYKIGVIRSHFFTRDAMREHMRNNRKLIINPENVDRMVPVGSSQSGPSGASFLNGTVIGGAVLGIASALCSVSDSVTLAVYLKNGQKAMIRFYSSEAYEEFQSDMFVF